MLPVALEVRLLIFCKKKHRKELLELMKLISCTAVSEDGIEVMRRWKQSRRHGENVTLT